LGNVHDIITSPRNREREHSRRPAAIAPLNAKSLGVRGSVGPQPLPRCSPNLTSACIQIAYNIRCKLPCRFPRHETVIQQSRTYPITDSQRLRLCFRRSTPRRSCILTHVHVVQQRQPGTSTQQSPIHDSQRVFHGSHIMMTPYV
jgi:hypothetical protein